LSGIAQSHVFENNQNGLGSGLLEHASSFPKCERQPHPLYSTTPKPLPAAVWPHVFDTISH
jgi:hypothetical protein